MSYRTRLATRIRELEAENRALRIALRALVGAEELQHDDDPPERPQLRLIKGGSE